MGSLRQTFLVRARPREDYSLLKRSKNSKFPNLNLFISLFVNKDFYAGLLGVCLDSTTE